MSCRNGIAAAISAGAFLMAGAGAASADQGGAAGNCGPPGQTIYLYAQVPGASTVDVWPGAPGQDVVTFCAPGHQGP
jgi:hypothetical protein